MFNLALAKRIAVILLAAILISSFVACGKKDVDVIVSSSDSSNTGSVNSKVEIKEDDNDDAASITSSDLEDLEEGTFGGDTSSFTPLPQVSKPDDSGNTNSSASSNTSSEPGYISNGPGVFVPSLNSSTPSSSTQNTSTPSSSTQNTSTPSSSTQDTSTPSSSTQDTSTPSSSTQDTSTPSSSTQDTSTPSSSTQDTSTPSSSNSSSSEEATSSESIKLPGYIPDWF